jgi:hypothetical protein
MEWNREERGSELAARGKRQAVAEVSRDGGDGGGGGVGKEEP